MRKGRVGGGEVPSTPCTAAACPAAVSTAQALPIRQASAHRQDADQEEEDRPCHAVDDVQAGALAAQTEQDDADVLTHVGHLVKKGEWCKWADCEEGGREV
jgi:hypothetical protein